jgi:hypothetical protein
MKKEFERPNEAARNAFKDQQAQDAPVAMADYRRTYEAKIDRMFELRRIRREKSSGDGKQQANGR